MADRRSTVTRKKPLVVKVRRFRKSDLEATLTLWRSVSEATYTFLELHTEEEDRAYFQDTILVENELWVATIKKRIAGYIAMRGDYIDRLYVAVDLHGGGVGTALLEHAKARYPSGLRLFTHQKNEQACAFYERHAFVPVRYGMSPPPESEPDVEYRWTPDARRASD